MRTGSEESVYNFLAELRSSSNLSDKAFDALSDDFAQGRDGSKMLTLHGTRYYLVYENTGIQDWIMLSLVPVSVVNASMDTLWHRTVEIVTAIACLLMVLLITLIVHRSRDALRRRDTEILYKDELFTRLSRNVDDVFFMLDAETSRTDYVSPNIERLLGVPLEQVRQDIRALRALHPKDSPDHDKNFLAGIQCGEQSEWDADYAHQQTGERRWFHIVAMGSEVAGRTKYILVMSDRTADRKINQALSEAVAAAEAASRAKSTFLSNMSHDIRTPMNAIIGFTTLAVSNIDNQERVKDYLTKTLSSSRHLLALINDILDMSRIESGKLQLEETEVNLPEMLHDIKTIVGGQVHAKQLELYMDALDVTDEDVYCDRTRMGQILLNLLSNAIKFTPAGGTVSVRVRQLAGTVRDCAQYEFRVRDNGIGMSPEFAQKIFEPFERERTSTVSRIQGTGLGMAITRNIVEMMGGTIKVQTEKNRGTEFIICLPLRVQTGSPPRGKDCGACRPQGAGGGRRFQHLRQRGKAADPCGNACGVDALRPGGRAACAAVHRAGRPLPRLYHRLAAAGHERHRGRAPDSQPERRHPHHHPDRLRLVGYRSGGEGGRRDGLLLQADVPVRPARHPADSHRAHADGGGAGHPAREKRRLPRTAYPAGRG